MLFWTAAESAPQIAALLEPIQSLIAEARALGPDELMIRGALSVLVLIGAALLTLALRMTLRALGRHVAPDETGRSRIGQWSMAIARLAIFASAFLLIARIWGLDLDALLAGPFGAFLRGALRIALIIALTLAALEFTNAALGRVLSRVASRARSDRRAAQVRTLTPLVTGVATSAFVIVGGMMALSELGVQVGPLLAGAGIVGLAVGFGAQTLVKDFLTGIFLVLEDIVSIGDVISIGDFTGTVEEMSLRTIKFRALDGTLHVFPYSEAQIIHNMTRGFSNAVIELSVAYSADVEKALRLMREVDTDMRADEELGASMIQPIEIFGVDALADSAVMLKARIRTAPGKQWVVRRAYLQRIKAAFDGEGVEIPFPHLKLIGGELSTGAGGELSTGAGG